MDKKTSGAEQQRREWIEPEVSELGVTETKGSSGTGGDGARYAPECARS